MTGGEFVTTGELHIAPESIEAVAQRVAELIAAATAEPASRPVRITAEEVSRWWGVSRRWVYDHAEELGARRMGSGRRPRLRFDPDEVAERLGEPANRGGGAPYMRGSRAIAGDCKSSSLSSPTRATVGRKHKRRPGRAEALPSGAPRWEARARKARSRLVERGWVESKSARGQWEITKTGRAKLRRDDQKANRGRRLRNLPSVAVAESEMAVAA